MQNRVQQNGKGRKTLQRIDNPTIVERKGEKRKEREEGGGRERQEERRRE